MNLNVFKILEETTVEGPGRRFCIWVKGCTKRCKGCWATQTWSHKKKNLISIEEIISRIKTKKEQGRIEGVTFLGGEPFEQAFALSHLAKAIQKQGLSVITFTGNNYENLKQKNDEDINRLLEYTDLLIDGSFQEENYDLSRPWVGSSNQRYIFLTDRYCLEKIKDIKNKIEVRIDKNGFIFVNGMGDFNKIKQNLCLLTPEKSL